MVAKVGWIQFIKIWFKSIQGLMFWNPTQPGLLLDTDDTKSSFSDLSHMSNKAGIPLDAGNKSSMWTDCHCPHLNKLLNVENRLTTFIQVGRCYDWTTNTLKNKPPKGKKCLLFTITMSLLKTV